MNGPVRTQYSWQTYLPDHSWTRSDYRIPRKSEDGPEYVKLEHQGGSQIASYPEMNGYFDS